MAEQEIQHAAPAVSLTDVQFAYPSGPSVIDGVSAAAHRGRVCAFLGPNGSGKSTLIKLILGMLSPNRGAVEVCGRSLSSMHASERAGIVSYVPQRGLASFAFSVEDVVAMGRHALSRNPQAVEDALSMCDLQHLRSRVYAELSVGQQQRVLLARAIAQSVGDGQVMLLDEPNSGMDLHYAHDTMLHLKQLAEQGMCVLVVLQDIAMAARYADDIWLLSHGKLVASGRWEEVLKPELLEPVYRVKIHQLPYQVHDLHDRPLFFAEPVGTLSRR